MALPLQLPDLLPRRVPALRLVPGPSLDLGPERLAEMTREVAEALEDLESFERELRSSFDRFRASLAAKPSGEVDCEGLEEVVEAVRDLERKFAAKWAEIKDSCERSIMRARELSPREPVWARYAEFLDRAIGALIGLLETLREVRLELAAILTEMDQEVDSPTFDDPEELKKYLESV